jgi:flavorubredoxin
MMKIAPNAELLHSKPGKVFLKNLTNRNDINSRVVEEDTEIDLGGKTLRFIKAPFLHWPETMFTYIPEDKILFPCDFLGCHFCDDRLFDDRVSDFSYAFKYYYDILFRPFKKYALQALDKVDNLDIDIIAPSHGPILRTEPQKYLELYREWSQPRFDENNVLIVYASAYGNTRRLAKSIQKGLEESEMKVALFDITATEINRLVDELEESTGILIGSPTIQGDAVKPIWDFLSSLITIDYKGKYGASFGSFGWSGEAPDQILDRLRGLRFKTPLEPYKVKITPTDEEVDKVSEFGRKFAEAIKE